jgi:hypothetical protein
MSKTIIMVAMGLVCFANVCMAQTDGQTQQRLADVEQTLEAQARTLKDLKEEGSIAFIVLFLFGLVLSMWAMNRQRSGCGWFIVGFIPVVNIVAGIIALSAENERRKSDTQQE